MREILQNTLVRLGYLTTGNNDFSEVIKAGSKELSNQLAAGSAKYINENGTKYIEFENNSMYKTYPILNKPALDKRDDYYLVRKSELINRGMRRKEYVKPTYLFKQTKQPRNIINILRKQNSIKFKVWDKVLAHQRFNKSNSYDENWKWETEMKALAVSNRANKPFYLAHQYDTRGRVYPDGYFLNYQGDEWSKASITSDIPTENLTLEGFKAMKIDLANHYGLDKLNYSERLSAVDNNNLPDKADKPILAAKSKEALDEALKTKQTSYLCAIDATASGMQILSILGNDERVAKLTNLTDTNNCYDIYLEVAKEIIADSINLNNLTAKDIRKEVKKAVMTVSYNSKKSIKDLYEYLSSNKIFVNEYTLANQLNVSPKITKVKDTINKLLLDTFTENDEQIIRFTMPDGFIVELPNIQKAMTEAEIELAPNEADKRLKTYCRIRYDKLGWDKELNWRGLVPNIIQSIDAYICRELIKRCKFIITTIHDSFSCHPNNISKMRTTYLTILDEIHNLNILEYIGKQINSNFVWESEKSFSIAINKDSYALC